MAGDYRCDNGDGEPVAFTVSNAETGQQLFLCGPCTLLWARMVSNPPKPGSDAVTRDSDQDTEELPAAPPLGPVEEPAEDQAQELEGDGPAADPAGPPRPTILEAGEDQDQEQENGPEAAPHESVGAPD